MKYDTVKIDWMDSCAVSGWRSIPEKFEDEDLMCVSIGMLIYEDKTKVGISASLGSGGYAANDVIYIPKFAIKKRKIIKKKSKK